MKTCDEKNKKQEQRGIEGARNDEGNLNLVTNCGFGPGLSHEIRFHSIESLDNIINMLTGFRDKWKADQ